MATISSILNLYFKNQSDLNDTITSATHQINLLHSTTPTTTLTEIINHLLSEFSTYLSPTSTIDPDHQHVTLQVLHECIKFATAHHLFISIDLSTTLTQLLGNLYVNARRSVTRVLSIQVLTAAWYTMQFNHTQELDTVMATHGLAIVNVLVMPCNNRILSSDMHFVCVESLLQILQYIRKSLLSNL